jgi:hypothetical protein
MKLLAATSTANPVKVGRRDFLSGAIAVVTLTPVPSALAAQDQHGSDLESDLGIQPKDLSAAAWNEVRARYGNLLRVYGSRLSSEERRRTAHILITNQHMLESIRTFIVQNGDPSACTLRLYDPRQFTTAAKQD